jgi:hypothetical protein
VSVLPFVGAGAAALGLLARFAWWLWRRRTRVRVELGPAQGPLTPGGPDAQLAVVTLINQGHADVVATEVGIARARKEPLKPPAAQASRGDLFRAGLRLKRHGRHESRFDLAWLPPDHTGERLPLWGFAEIDGKRYYSREPLKVKDLRPGSPTLGQNVYP